MEVFIAFAVFIAAMAISLVLGSPMLIPLAIGFVCFFGAALRRKYPFGAVGKMAFKGAKDARVVLYVILMIGLLTGLWRSAGTVTFFIYYGIRVIEPSLFIFIAFVLTCCLSYAIGTSFGVAGTVGVIFMALARSGGVSELITAGAILSGVYFGDRSSPVSSSANLVAAVTQTTLYRNVKVMAKTGVIPIGLCCAIYFVLSIQNPIHHIDPKILTALTGNFHISWWLAAPAVIMLVLPLFRVNVLIAMASSIISALLISAFVQGMGIFPILRCAFFGYRAPHAGLSNILNGGGLVSMLEVCGIVLLSCAYSGIFRGTNMLSGIQDILKKLVGRTGKFNAMILVCLVAIGVFANQTVAAIMCSDLMGKFYEKQDGEKTELAVDIENSSIVLAGLVPWSVACMVPLRMLGVGMGALPYAALLYLVPLCYIFSKRIWYR